MIFIKSLFLQIAIIVCNLVNYNYGWSLMKSCPFNEMCSCDGDIIDCNGVPFLRLPDFTNVTFINNMKIAGNGLEVIENDSFPNLRTSSIVLDNNRIHSIQDKAFFKMNKTLNELSLNFNNLEEIPINAMQSIEQLEKLSLNENQISSAVVNWSTLGNTITELSLDGNEIDSLPLQPEKSLSNIKSLTKLSLAQNALPTLEPNSLPTSLVELNASSNAIKEFPQHLLSYLRGLEILSLSDNFIDSIKSETYVGKLELRELDLSHNRLELVKNWFSKSINVKRLNLSYNKIKSIEKESLSDLNIEKIDLSYNKLSNVDENFSPLEYTLQYIDLSHNRFTKIPESLKKLKTLQTLKLDYNHLLDLKGACLDVNNKLSLVGNKISIFPYEALTSLKSLRTLDISYNRIADIRKSDFKAWAHSLSKLFLQSNSILFLVNDTFQYTARITELSLSYNNIGSIDSNAFNYIERSLEKIDVSFGLKGFGFPVAFFKLKAIKHLILDNNNINSIPDTMNNLVNLEKLILDFNNIKELKSGVFSSNAHKFLKDIRLSFNKIQNIESKTFADLQNLQSVSLHNNKIIKITEHSFTNLSQDLSIYLSNNEIEIIRSKSFSNLPKLKKVDLHGNNILTFDYTIFENVTTENEPMTLNLSRNRIEKLEVPSYQRNPVYIKVLDLSHNKLAKIPEKLIEIQTSLKSLDLSYNEITAIESEDFYSMIQLDYLCLTHNKIVNLKPNAFISLKKLQILNMAHNHIEVIQNEQFKDVNNLRILDLSFNNINSIPSNAFENTKVEKLSLSGNKISILSSILESNITNTIHSLDLSHNEILNVNSNILQVLPKINDLNLCHNKITTEALNAFQNSNSLFSLQLCNNQLASVSSDSFKNISNLRFLNLAETDLVSFPNLTLPSLRCLNVSGNKITNITEGMFTALPKLKILNLSNNQLNSLTTMKWIQLQNLKDLDLSLNPIKVLDQSCFYGLYSLRSLNLLDLKDIQIIESDIFKDLVQISSLKILVKSSVNIDLSKILSNLERLKELVLSVADDRLHSQLPAKFPKKLHLLEITGKNLKFIEVDSLHGLKDMYNLDLRITGTSISHLPKHIFTRFINRGFKIDVSNNQVTYVGPEALYKTIGETRRYGTRSFPGGIHVGQNPLACGCNTKWLAQWIRRHLTETLAVNSMTVESRLNLIEDMNNVVCSHSQTKQMFPIISYDVTFDDVLCVYVLNVPKVSSEKGSGSVLNINILLIISAMLIPLGLNK